jgi:hypothetical protein
MDIGEVVRAMKADPTKRFARKGWNGRNMYIQLQVPDKHSKMTLPYVYIRTVQGNLVPWLCSQADLIGEDWIQVGGHGNWCDDRCINETSDTTAQVDEIKKLLDEKYRFMIFYKAFHDAHEEWLAAHCFSTHPPEQDPFLQTIKIYYDYVFEGEHE